MQDGPTDLTGHSEIRTEQGETLEPVQTRITSVHYSKLFNLGDYQNEKIGVTAQVGEGDDPEAVMAMLMRWVEDQRGLRKKREEAEWEMRELERQEARLKAEAEKLEERKRQAQGYIGKS